MMGKNLVPCCFVNNVNIRRPSKRGLSMSIFIMSIFCFHIPINSARLLFSACELGHYGQSCAEICGRCYGDLPCNPLNGVCEKGCKAGWNGTTCKESMFY